MQESYKYKNLLIGELVTMTHMGVSYGPIEVTEGPYIFCKANPELDESCQYIEVFTEDEYDLFHRPSKSTGGRNYKKIIDSNVIEFNKTYIKEIDSIYNYLTEEEKQALEEDQDNFSLTKRRIVKIYNDIHNNLTIKRFKQKELEEKLEKKYTKAK